MGLTNALEMEVVIEVRIRGNRTDNSFNNVNGVL